MTPAMTDSYVELAPTPALADLVRTVWIQQTGDRTHVQYHLPTGGMELHFRSAACRSSSGR
jgi:hypothetical protein